MVAATPVATPHAEEVYSPRPPPRAGYLDCSAVPLCGVSPLVAQTKRGPRMIGRRSSLSFTSAAYYRVRSRDTPMAVSQRGATL
jgi:hypothetical protein